MSDSKRVPRVPFSADEDAVIRQNYGQMSARDLGQLIGRSEKAVYNYISRKGITRREHRDWSASELAELRELYEHLTVPQIAERLGRSADSVRQRVTRLDAGKRASAEERLRATLALLRSARRDPAAGFPEATVPAPAPLNCPEGGSMAPKTFIARSTVHDYFAAVARADQAYVLGLLAADGNVASGHPRVNLGLQAKDMRAVEFVRDRLNPAARLSPAKDGRMVLQVTSARMVADLAPFGIVPRKSRTLPWPDGLGELQRPFLLGYFDGDGSMFLPRDRHERERPGWNACSGSESFLIAMREYVRAATGVTMQEIQHRADADLWQVSVTGLGAVVVDEWLHQEGIGLARKRFPERVLAYYRD